MHRNRTAITRHWLRYEHGSKRVILLFGLDDVVTVKLTEDILIITNWRCLFHFNAHELVT